MCAFHKSFSLTVFASTAVFSNCLLADFGLLRIKMKKMRILLVFLYLLFFFFLSSLPFYLAFSLLSNSIMSVCLIVPLYVCLLSLYLFVILLFCLSVCRYFSLSRCFMDSFSKWLLIYKWVKTSWTYSICQERGNTRKTWK